MTRTTLPRFAALLFRWLLPHAERKEVIADLATEYTRRKAAAGGIAARLWIWRQVLSSAPALVRRGARNGWTGFEPEANRMRPGGGLLHATSQEARFTLRRLMRRPTYTTLVVATLALGVAGTATIYSVAKSFLLDPLPIRGEEEVVVFWQNFSWSDAEFDFTRGAMTGFQNVVAYRPRDMAVTLDGQPPRLLPGIAATSELFATLGVAPALGRGFGEADQQMGAEPVAVISQSLWRELGGRPSVIGQRVEFSGVMHTVIGVMPEGFWFPDPMTAVWTNDEIDPEDRAGNLTLVGRIRPGLTLDGALASLSTVTTMLGERFSYSEMWDKTANPQLTPVRESLLGNARPGITALIVAMGLILLVACGNVAALMLGQVERRGSELAVRRALGAGRRRLLHQIGLEAIAIGILAGLVGAILAVPGFRMLVGALPLGNFAEAAELDWSVFFAAMATAVLSATLIALVPAVVIWRGDVYSRMSNQRTGGVTGGTGRMQSALVIGQIALVLVLTGGAALLIRTVDNLRAIDTGIDSDQVAVLDVLLPSTGTSAELPGRMRTMLDEIATIPGVQSAGATQKLPLRGMGHNWGISVEGQPDLAPTTTAFRIVTEDYLETLGVQLRSGRLLRRGDADPDAEEGVVVINQALADKYYPGADPLGRLIAFSSRWDRIIGVVDDVAEGALVADPMPARYVLFDQVDFYAPPHTIVVKAAPGADLATVLDQSRRAIQRVAPDVAIAETTTMDNVTARALGPARQVMPLLAVLGILGLVLGTIGVYGVVSHFVNRRWRDWGVRIALGLRPGRLVRQVVGRGVGVVGVGLALGLVVFFGLSKALAGLLYGVEPADPISLVTVMAILLTVGAAAAWLPARRAASIDPNLALRQQ